MISACKIWFCPRKAARRMNELEGEREEISARLTAAEADAAQLREAFESMRESSDALLNENESLRTSLDSLEKENVGLQRDNKALRDKLAHYAETSSRVQEIERMLGRMEEVKTRYEQRISRLRDYIAAMKSASAAVNGEADEMREIDMRDGYFSPGSSSRMSEPENNWLESLPD